MEEEIEARRWEAGQKQIQRENEEKEHNLGQSKDRAQLTATSAMSVVHVALLKEILVAGPERNRYFTVTVTLICLCLVLQVSAGFLSLMVGHLRGYYTRYQDDAAADFCQNVGCSSNVVCCRQKRGKKRRTGDKNDDFDDILIDKDSEGGDGVDEALPGPPDVDGDDGMASGGCCPCEVTTKIFYDYEYAILDGYEDWHEEYIELELEETRSDVHTRYLTERVITARERLAVLNSRKHEISEEHFRREAAAIQDTIDDALNRKSLLEGQRRRSATARARGDVLWERASAIRKRQVLKRASLYQRAMNYIFYLVFVLNAFITGLGVSAGVDNVGSGGELADSLLINSTFTI